MTQTPKDQERRLAKLREGRRQPGSGSGWVHNNDVKDDEYLWECKQTEGKSLSIKLEDVENVRRNALSHGRKWAMHLQIQGRRMVLLDEADDRSPTNEPA